MPKGKDEKQEMLSAEKLLAYVPGDISRMVAFYRAAEAGGFTATAAWIEAILRRAYNEATKWGQRFS